MTITKPGVRLIGVCAQCGCEFEATPAECHTEVLTPYMLASWLTPVGRKLIAVCDCPACGKVVRMRLKENRQ